MGDKWTLLIIRDLVAGPRRFVELQRVLPGISTEQLRSRLNRMVADGLLTRQRYREVPPRVDYELTERAKDLVPVVAELSRWGRKWAWGAPREGEAVDVGAVVRSGVGLLDGPKSLKGSVELRVGDKAYGMHVARGRATTTEGALDRADAAVHGDEAAWIAALGPDADRSHLRVTGDARLAGAVLDGLGAGDETVVAATG